MALQLGDGDGYFTINGFSFPKGQFYINKSGPRVSVIATENLSLKITGRYDEWIGASSETFANVDAAGDYIDDLIAVAGSGGGGDGTATRQDYIFSNLGKFEKKLATTPETTTIAFVGDSTSDFTAGAATQIPTYFQKHTVEGGLLEGFDVGNNLLDFGANGNSIANFLVNSPTGKGINDVIAASPDLIVFCYGINDVRLGSTSKDNLKAKIVQAINKFRLESPNSDILLRMPNSFLSVSPNGWIATSTYGTVAAAAQAYSKMLYDAYKELENHYDNVVLFNTQELITGRESLPVNSRMIDELHPKYEAVVDEIAKTISDRSYKVFVEADAKTVIASNYEQPWTISQKVLDYDEYYLKIATGSVNGQGTTYLDISGFAYSMVSALASGDIMIDADGNHLELKVGYNAVASTSTVMRITGGSLGLDTAPTFSGKVTFYRHRFNHIQSAERYLRDKKNYPYAHKVTYAIGANGYLILGASMQDDGIVTPKMKHNVSAMMEVQNGDVIVAPGIEPYILTGATFTTFGNNQFRINVSGKDFTPYNGLSKGFIFGNHPFESVIPRVRTETRDANTFWRKGDEIFNITLTKKQVYNGTAWETITSEVPV